MINRSHGDFFTQKIKINEVSIPREEFFLEKIKNKKTIHYGCADFPIYNESNNLHLFLSKNHDDIDGYDVDIDLIVKMINSEKFPPNTLFTFPPDKKYDFLLIPETIEHINNVSEFLESILINAKEGSEILITSPNAFSPSRFNDNEKVGDLFFEKVHPDHNCWYSLYTLPNIIEKSYTNINRKVIFKEIGTLENQSMIYCLFEVK